MEQHACQINFHCFWGKIRIKIFNMVENNRPNRHMVEINRMNICNNSQSYK